MNYLAHLLLASHSDAAMLGAFLGDFVKGRDYLAFDPEIRRDILVHRRSTSLCQRCDRVERRGCGAADFER